VRDHEGNYTIREIEKYKGTGMRQRARERKCELGGTSQLQKEGRKERERRRDKRKREREF
jgi:hypothetical protein